MISPIRMREEGEALREQSKRLGALDTEKVLLIQLTASLWEVGAEICERLDRYGKEKVRETS